MWLRQRTEVTLPFLTKPQASRGQDSLPFSTHGFHSTEPLVDVKDGRCTHWWAGILVMQFQQSGMVRYCCVTSCSKTMGAESNSCCVTSQFPLNQEHRMASPGSSSIGLSTGQRTVGQLALSELGGRSNSQSLPSCNCRHPSYPL